MNHMSDDETKAIKKRTSTSGVLANLKEDANSQDDGSVEKVDPNQKGGEKNEQKSYLGHVLLQGFLKNSTTSAQVKKRAEAKLGLKALKDEYRKRKAIEACITCTLTNFKSQIMRIELTLSCLLKNYPPLDPKDLEFLEQHHKDEGRSQQKSSRMININRIEEGNPKFFDLEYRKQKHTKIEKKLGVTLLGPNMILSLTPETVSAFSRCFRAAKDKSVGDISSALIEITMHSGNKKKDYIKLLWFLFSNFDNMSIYVRKQNYYRSFWTNDSYFKNIEILNHLTMKNHIVQDMMLEICEAHPDTLPKLFFCYLQLMLFTVHKTFYGPIWSDHKEDFKLFRDFFKNLKENGFQPFKVYFGTNAPQMKDCSFNMERRTYSEIYMAQFEKMVYISKLSTNDDKYIQDSDRPELFGILTYILEGINEGLTGPCTENQDALFSTKIVSPASVFLNLARSPDASPDEADLRSRP